MVKVKCTKLRIVNTSEYWFLSNKETYRQVKAGLADAKKGRLVMPNEDFLKYID